MATRRSRTHRSLERGRCWSRSLVAAFALFQVSKARCFALAGEAICRVETDQRLIALTFDDGPTPAGVDWASGVLRRHGPGHILPDRRAIPGKEGLVRRLLADGHEIGNHSFSHVRMALHSSAFYDGRSSGPTHCCARRACPPPICFARPTARS